MIPDKSALFIAMTPLFIIICSRKDIRVMSAQQRFPKVWNAEIIG